jgi:hypothetical protein
MKRIGVPTVTVLLLGGLYWIWVRGFGPQASPQVEKDIPAEVIAVLFVKHLPNSWKFLRETGLDGWFNIEAEDWELMESLAQEVSQIKDQVEEFWVILHSLQVREERVYRIHFSAWLKPEPTRLASVREWILDQVCRRFGEDCRAASRSNSFTIVEGGKEGEIFYLLDAPPFLLLSNSPAGWRAIEEARRGQAPSFADAHVFPLWRKTLGSEIALYFRGLGEVVPEFIYVIESTEGEVVDRYIPVSPSEGALRARPE